MQHPLRLSAFDSGSPTVMVRLLPVVEQLGYHRFLIGEHHDKQGSGNPTMLAALACTLSERIRIGTAGVILNYYSPVHIAECFRLLELVFPGRIDLGVVGGFAGTKQDPIRAALLDGRPCPDFEQKVQMLCALMRTSSDEAAREAFLKSSIADQNQRSPQDVFRHTMEEPDSIPTLWLCGASTRTAALAGRSGMAFCTGRPFGATPDVVAEYRASFRAVPLQAEAECILLCSVTCYDSHEEQRRMERFLKETIPWFRPDCTGVGSECSEQIRALAEAYDVDELVLYTPLPIDERIRSYEIIAESLQISGMIAYDRVGAVR
jgi:luciferase family oxidoreductase group 1